MFTKQHVCPRFFYDFSPKMAAQDGPRSTQDESKLVLDRVFCLLIFRFVFGSFLVPFWCHFRCQNGTPGCARTCGLASWGGPSRSWDRLGSVLLSSCRSGSLFWPSWGRFGVVLGRSGGRFGAFSAFQLIDSTHQLINSSLQPINSSIQLIDPSTHRFTHQPINSSIQLINSRVLEFYTEGR